MNKIELIGRPTRDLELQYGGENGTGFVKFILAVPRRYKKGKAPETDFINCVAFRNTAEFLNKYVKKGMRIAIVGRVQTGAYERNGETIYTATVIAEDVEILETLEAKKVETTSEAEKATTGEKDSFMNIPDYLDDEIPFR